MDRADIKKAAQVIAKQLNEGNKHATRQIERLIEHLGLELVQSSVEEALQIEADGGLMLKDGSRKRTTGGVFFHIIRPKLTPEQLAVIFPPKDWKKIKAAKKRRKQAEKSQNRLSDSP